PLLVRVSVGVQGSRRAARVAQGTAPLRIREAVAAELQVTSGRSTQMRITLRVWRQAGPNEQGRLETYVAEGVSPDMSFLEMLDVVNEGLIAKGQDPIAFDSDCREGICGMCGVVVNDEAHGPRRGTTSCQLHMRSFRDGDTLPLEPWRTMPFPVVKDL